MAITHGTTFSRRVVDHVTDELVTVLSNGEAYEFKALFSKVFEGLKVKKAVSGGEEMLRLRSYEKLLSLARRGLVLKTGKSYTGLAGLQEASSVNRLARMELAAETAAQAAATAAALQPN
jgi:hypothetical protein